MRTLKTKDAIINAMPKPTDRDIAEMNKCFTPYIFYRDNENRNERECWCTYCNKHYTVDKMPRTDDCTIREFCSRQHNDMGICPKCKTRAMMKQTGRAKDCKSLTEWKRVVVVSPVGKNQVFLNCTYAVKRYRNQKYIHNPSFETGTIYYLTPGAAREFKSKYTWDYAKTEFREIKNISEPYTKTWSYNIARAEKRGYGMIGRDKLNNTFLKYSQLGEFEDEFPNEFHRSDCCGYFIEIPTVKYLAMYSKYPCMEMMIKMGFYSFVFQYVYLKKPMKRYVDWSGKTPIEVFKMNRVQFNEFKENYNGIGDFLVYQNLKNIKNTSYKSAIELCELFGNELALKAAEKIKKYNLNFTHTLNYLKKQAQRKGDKPQYQLTANHWTDYITFATELKYDFSRKDVLFPKKLKQAHDNASDAVVRVHDKQNFQKYQKRYEKLKKLYEYDNGKYCITIPMGINDIVEEGKVLKHCVGGYAARHIDGKTTILFMRKSNNPSNRLVTIELNESDRRICQNYGVGDRRVTKEEKAFIDEWIAWVRAGSKRKKNKKAAAAA